MTGVEEIYRGAENLINQLIRQESAAQGHYLTGAMDDSLSMKIKKQGKEKVMEGFAVLYTQFVNDGVPAESASMKQFPFVVKYFQLRGLDEQSARGAAAATIKTWMKQGMSTQASKRFSSTGARQHMIESAFTGGESVLNEFMSNSFDFAIEEGFQSISKNETV
jgi:hypothetical protein